MPNKIIIDDHFIEKWQQKYDEEEKDEEEYNAIRAKVSENNIISEDLFIRILDWKAPRVKGIVKRDNFEEYAEGIRNAIEAPEDKKIEILDELYGIGIPVASTILHFRYPEIFPIVDIRTVEVLQHAGCLDESKRYYNYRDTTEGYAKFCQVIKNIVWRYPKWSLRQIDKALFAYHKFELKPKTKARCE